MNHTDMQQSIVDKISVFDGDIEVQDVITLKNFKKEFKLYSSNTGKYNDYNIYLSRTAKVVMNDDYYCRNCDGESSIVVISKARHRKNSKSGQRLKDNFNYCVTFWTYDKSQNDFFIMTKDHIIPKAFGGRNAYENLQCLCEKCNAEKGCEIDQENYIATTKDSKPSSNNDTPTNLYQLYKKDAKRFKKIKRRIKKMEREIPWYYRLLGVDKFINRRVGRSIASMEEADLRDTSST